MNKLQIVNFIFQFAESELNYLILRNYENLPEDEGHDIDLLIDKSELNKTDLLVAKLKEEYHIPVFKKECWYGLRGYVLIINNELLHLDFFYYVQWNRLNFFDTHEALSRKIRFKEKFWVINEKDLCYYCWCNYIIAKGKIKKTKYIDMALTWQRKYNTNPNIDIEKYNCNHNKKYLFIALCKKIPLRKIIINTIKNMWTKFIKIFSMDGRIYISDVQESKILETVRHNCFCNQMTNPANLPQPIQLFKLLYKEYAILIKSSVWKNYKFKSIIPKKYVITDVDDIEYLVGDVFK